MIALSIRQPWAWLIVHGHKDIENRNWYTRFRGYFAVHASKTFDLEGYEWVGRRFPGIQMPEQKYFERGGIVGIAKIIECVNQSKSPWFFGDYGFVLTNQSVSNFFPLKGKLGFFEFEDLPGERR